MRWSVEFLVIFPSTVIMRFEVAALERHFASNSFASNDALRVGKSEREKWQTFKDAAARVHSCIICAA
jgi:hypothetical protein